MRRFSVVLTLLYLTINLNEMHAQPVPAGDENIPFLMTFGPKAELSWGDDDFSQTFFFKIPEDFKEPFFIRIYDPDIGGEIDELNGVWDTKMRFSVYGGNDCFSNKDAQDTQPQGNYQSGTLLGTKVFGVNTQTDDGWYTFGPYNPTEGEFQSQFSGYIFKIICNGLSGDDGNMYRFYLSVNKDQNIPIEGGNAFAYEYSFRMHDNPAEVSHIYPYVDENTISVKLSNFDWDNDGFIRTVSVARASQMCEVSAESNWVETEFKIMDEEKNTSLDIQFIKKRNPPVKNNNVVVNVKNQKDENLAFFTIPIGGVPKPPYAIKKPTPLKNNE